MKPTQNRRILALSLDWQGFGFAVFDGPHELLDYGTRNFRRRVKIPLEAKFLSLLDANRPDAIVLRAPKTAKRQRIVATIAKSAKAEKVSLVLISDADIQKAFAPSNQSKYQIAAAIAERYPELLLRLPSARKSWESEKFGITIFEAVGAGFAYYGLKVTSPKT